MKPSILAVFVTLFLSFFTFQTQADAAKTCNYKGRTYKAGQKVPNPCRTCYCSSKGYVYCKPGILDKCKVCRPFQGKVYKPNQVWKRIRICVCRNGEARCKFQFVPVKK